MFLMMYLDTRAGPEGGSQYRAAPSLAVAALRGAAVYKNASCSHVAFAFSAAVDILIKIINENKGRGQHRVLYDVSGPRRPEGPTEALEP